uniref:NAD-dependent protein deacylase n=1 Tax=Timema tahoe TaxID=61484 RepID=A0A7R9FEZ2_9NEOP|nr:unnamed protein product [Timema tahoe]
MEQRNYNMELQVEHENGSSTEVEYVLKRLIRGMGSSRANSRNGFFSVLVALLSTVKSMKVSDILNLVKKHLCITSNIGKTEEAEIYTGQILVFGALIRSGQFVSNATVEEQHEVLSNLLVAGQQRSYLPIAVYAFLEELLLQINGDIFHKLVWPIMEAEVKKPLAINSLFISIPCFAHSLQLAIHDAKAECPGVCTLLTKAKAIVGHYSRSPSARKRLHSVMEEMGLPVLELIQFVDTRWSSEYNMLSRLHAVRKAVGAELANSENNIEVLTAVEWKQAAGIVEVLGPLADATKEISGDSYPTSSMVIPILHCLKSHLNVFITSKKDGVMFARSLDKALKSRFSFYDSDPIFCPSMLCDPRFRGVLIDDMVAVNTLAIEVKKLSDKSSLEPNVRDEQPSCSSSSSGLWSSFDSIPNTTQPAIDNNSEVKEYLNEPREISKSFHVHHPVYKEFAEQLATSPLLPGFWTQGVEPWLAKPNKNRDLLTLHIFQVVLANLTDKSQPPSRTLLPAVIPFSSHARQSLLSPTPSLLPPALICTTSSPHPVILPPFSHTTSCIHPEQEVVWLDHDHVDPIQLQSILLPLTTLICKMLSTNFLSMMVKHLTINTSPKPELTIEANKALRLVTESFTEDMQDKDESILDILRKFLFYPGQLMFEKFTGTRTVQILSNKLKASGVKELATLYQNVVTCKMDKVTGLQGETEPWHTAERKYAGELLTKLISNAPAVQDDHEWKLDMMKFFLELGMFHPINKDENNVVSHLLAGSLKNNFFRLFDQHPKLALPRLNNLCNTQNAIIHYLDSLLKKKKWVQRLRKPWSPEAKASFQKMIAAIKELELPKKGLPQSTVLIFRTMLMQMGIHLFINPDLAIEVLEELHSCLNEIDTGKGKFDETSMEKEVQWVDVVVDLILSLLSINNHTLRIMINWVFPHLCPFLTPLALKQIIQVLDPKSEEHPLIDSLDFDSDEDIASDEDITNDDDTANEEALSSDGKHDSDTDSNIEEAEEPANAELQRAVRQALGTADTITDTESLDLDDMDPEEGQRINKELAQAFKKYKSATNNRKSKKFPRKDKALSHFRVRVLDLIEIYISSEPSLESCLDLVMPLFHLLEYCIPNIHQKPLESRVRTCISKLTGLKKFEVGKVTQEQLAELASKLLSKGERTSLVFFDMNSKIAECCCFLVKASKHIPTPVIVPPIQWKMMEKIEVPPLTDVLRNALLDYFQNRGTLLQLELFQKLVQQMWDGNWIIATLLAYFANAPKIRPYKQYQAMELLKIFFKENRSLQTELSPDEEWKFSRPEQVLLLKSIKLLKQKDSYKQKSLCKLLELLSQVHHCGKKINIELSKNWHVLGQALQMYKKNTQDIASSTKKSINKMLSLLGLQIVDQEFKGKPKDQVQKNNADQESVIEPTTAQVQDGNADQMSIVESATADGVKSHPQTNGIDELSAQQDKRVKNKRLKQIAKNNILKKESTKLRTDAMSVGLQSIDFKGADYTAVRDEYLSSGDKYYPFFVKENTNMEDLSQILTGAGVSAESGVPTFRGAGGFWRKYVAQDLATPEAFTRNPSLVWEFYHYRRELVLTKHPNRAHEALAECESRLKREGKNFLLITQNIDGLHLKAGSQEVLELHGSLFKTRCLKCGRVAENRDSPICPALKEKGAPEPEVKDSCVSVEDLPHCSETNCHGLLRPHVVWFGEGLDQKILIKAGKALEKCDLCLVIGTSSVVYPAAMFAPQVAARGIPVAEFNIEATPATYDFKFHFEEQLCSYTDDVHHLDHHLPPYTSGKRLLSDVRVPCLSNLTVGRCTGTSRFSCESSWLLYGSSHGALPTFTDL